MMTHKESDKWLLWQRVFWVTGAVIGIISLITLAIGGILQLYVFPVVASNEDLCALKKTLETNYMTKEVFHITLEQVNEKLFNNNKEISETKAKVDKIYVLLLSMKRGE